MADEPGIYIDLLDDGSLIVDGATGEVIEQHGNDRLTVLAQRRHDAAREEKAWGDIKDHYDRTLLANDAGGAYGEVVINRRSRKYPWTDMQSFAEAVMNEELTKDEIVQVIAAANGFKREALPEVVQPFFDALTQKKTTRPWIESSIVRKNAPKLRVVQRDEPDLLPALEASVEQIKAGRAVRGGVHG